MAALHDEVVVTVSMVNEWGCLVQLEDGTTGFIDKTKTLAWAGEQAPLIEGERVVVVIDDTRSPCRLSALPKDLEIARSLRGAGGK